MSQDQPPAWADATLRLLLAARDRQSVSGDLLEEYRTRVRPERGRRGADWWFLRQVAGFAWRACGAWGVLLGVTLITRAALDWFNPPPEFALRATLTTGITAMAFLGAGFVTAWRGCSIRAAALTGVVTAAIGALISMIGNGLVLAIWHDAQTLSAIGRSGGLAETFTLPVILLGVGAVVGAIGGAVGSLTPDS